MTTSTTVAINGLGRIGRAMLRLVVDEPSFELVAVNDPVDAGMAIRAPVPIGSIADITFVTSRRTTVEEVNQIFAEEAETTRFAGVLGVSRDPLVSSDIVGDSRASVVDLELTRFVNGDLVKVMSWYDNEWGYANQMVRKAVSATSGVGPRPVGAA
jgi:glyceraldehyde 3-phosphate dehydrogenase